MTRLSSVRRALAVLALPLALGVAADAAMAQSFRLDPEAVVPPGDALHITLQDLTPGETVEITAERAWGQGDERLWRSAARYVADERGIVDLARHAPVSGDYAGADAAGLFWSMRPTEAPPAAGQSSQDVRLVAHIGDGRDVSTSVRFASADPAVRSREIPGFPAARLYVLPGDAPRPVVVVLHGAEGGVGASERFGPRLASLGYAVVGLPYYSPDWGAYGPPKAIPGLPGSFIDIPVDQLESLRGWLKQQPEADADRIALFGGSKGAEFALIAASRFDWIDAVAVFAPSDLVWEGWGLETLEAEGTRSSFSFEGQPLPFMPYVGFVEGLLAGPAADLLKIHEDGRAAHPGREAAARIPVETYEGALMLVAGDLDRMWSSGRMARNIAASRAEAGLETELLLYPDAGHDVAGDGWVPTLEGVERGGGSPAGNARAQADAWPRLTAFLATHLGR